jgi:hypothetical protein
MLMDEQKDDQSNWEYKTESASQDYEGSSLAEATGVPMQKIPAVEWSASEYIAHEKSAGWYALFSLGSIVTVALVFIITRDILASIVVLMACGAISVFAVRKPDTNNYVIDENGIKVKDKTYTYAEFRSFSVVEEGGINSLWLKPLKRFTPPVVMYCSPADEQKIVDVLANFLPNEERELDAIDRFSKRMRF